jgi:hypothetical protein
MVGHEVKLQGATIAGKGSEAPVLLDRRDPEFLAEMLRQYRAKERQSELLDNVVPVKGSSSPPLLYQPVQRVMHLAMMEAFCQTPGSPRLDHSKIDSAGVVIRRVPIINGKLDLQSGNLDCWMQRPDGRAGWMTRNTATQQLDPDPTRRPLPHTGQSYLDGLVNAKMNGTPLAEAFSPAFAAPPDVCADARKTLIYAVLPLTSSEVSATPQAENFEKQERPRLATLSNKPVGDIRGTGRYQNPDRVYQVFGFLRVKCEEGCPPKIVWSKPSIPFRIAPWYDGPGVPVPPVILPDLTNKDTLNKLKPNVSFGVPAGIFDSIQGASLDGLMKGNKPGGGLNLDWICGFNIPIITICAFFVLNIFLSLLNIIFFWLPLVKICIPIPKGTLNSD